MIETVSNDAEGKIKFSALEFKRGEEGTHLYHVEEVKGTETGMEYDGMVATVNVTVTKDGKVLTLTTQMPEDTEFNNKVTPLTPPVTPPTPPVTPPTPPVTPPTPETPKEGELPNTGEKSTTVVAAIGAVLGLFGLGLLTKRKEDEV